jgi:two-component system NtrC family sensor kinase
MTYHWIVPLAAAVLNALLGAVVIFRDPRRRLHQLFGFLSVTLVLWNLNIFVLYFETDPSTAMYWSRVFRVGTLMAPSVAAHMFAEFAGWRSRRQWALVLAGYALSILLIGANASGTLVSNLHEYQWGLYPTGTQLYALVPVLVAYGLLLGVGVLVQVVRTSPSPRKRQQAKLWLAGTAIAWPLALTNLLAPLGVPFYPLGNLANVAYCMFIAYGMIWHRLMDVEFVLTKGISYAVVGTLLIIPAFSITLVMQRWAFGNVNVDFSFVMLILFVGIGVLFPTLRRGAELRVERSLFPEKQSYRSSLREFTKRIVRILERDRLVRELGGMLTSVLGLERAAIFVRSQTEGPLNLEYVAGPRPDANQLLRDSVLVRTLETHGEALLRDEAVLYEKRVSASRITTTFLANGWEVCVPLIVNQELVGMLGLGCKPHFGGFSVADLDLLNTLAAEAAIALDNARLYEELRQSRDIIHRAGRLSALGTLAAGIAHEIRNPLVSIQTFFQLAPERLQDAEFMTSFLRLTEGEVHRISNLISELLNFAKSTKPSLREVVLDDEVERALVLLEPQANKSHVDLQWHRCNEALSVYADVDQMKQVLVNLVLNAIQATPAGGSVTVSTTRISHEGRDWLQVEIADTGSGISGELREDIFNPFFTTKTKGTGLGLPIAHQIVAEHGGFIAVESSEGRGSRFYVNLPILETDLVDMPSDAPKVAVSG